MVQKMSLDRPVREVLSGAGFTLRADWTMDEALAALRSGRASAMMTSPVIYFYVVDEAERLVGVVPTRRLILAAGSARVGEIMTRELVTLQREDRLFDAMELFAMHRLLALPVVDGEGKFLGIVDVSQYTDEMFELAQNQQLNEVFQLIGLHLERHRMGRGMAGALRGFRLRMPWLLANVAGGLCCAALGAIYEATMQRVVLLALFIPLILTLAESIAVQSMTLAIEQAAGGGRRRFAGVLGMEVVTAMLLGVCCAVLVGVLSLLWRGPVMATVVIGGALAGSMLLAAMLGRAVPRLIHGMKLNPRIASGPITLAVVDVVTVAVYLTTARVMLG